MTVGQQQPAMQEMINRLRPAVPAYGIISIEPPQYHPAPLGPGTPQDGQRPPKVGRIAYRPVQRDKKAFKLVEIIALVIADVGDIYSRNSLPDRFDIWSLIGVVTAWHRTREPTPRHAGKRNESLIFFRERAGRKYRNRR